MTPARVLAVCRDEWPALRWRWSRDAWGCVTLAGRARGADVVRVDHFLGYTSAAGRRWYFQDPAGIRRTLRAARYALANL